MRQPSTAAQRWAWWEAAVAGGEPPVHEDEPHTGYFAVRKFRPGPPSENRGAVGEFFWDGYESTLFWVDPANRLAAVLFIQKRPFDGTLHHDFREAVYGAGYQGPAGDEGR